jgi:hypothetical protein
LELRKKVLGPEHPSTLTSMNNLALVFGDQGKYGAAEGDPSAGAGAQEEGGPGREAM